MFKLMNLILVLIIFSGCSSALRNKNIRDDKSGSMEEVFLDLPRTKDKRGQSEKYQQVKNSEIIYDQSSYYPTRTQTIYNPQTNFDEIIERKDDYFKSLDRYKQNIIIPEGKDKIVIDK